MPRYTLRVNRRTHTIEAEPDDSLLFVLRDDLQLTGAKYGCGEGECGACTVLVDGQARRSCITKIETAAGHEITTIEGLADGERLHPVQQAFIDHGAFQCGFCTPGFVLMAHKLLQDKPNPSDDDIRHYLSGNLCRCAAYPEIIAAVKAAARG